MNRNSIRSKVKMVTCCLAGVAMLGSSFVADAAVSAGATDFVSVVVETTSGNAGVGAGLADCLASASAEESKEVQVQESEAPAETSEFANIGVSNIEEDSYINIRSEANGDSEVVGKLYSESAVTVIATEGEWYQITSGDCNGYIKAEYITMGDEELAKSISRRVAVVEADTLNIRDDTTTEGTLLGCVEQGDQLLVSEELDGWVKVYTEEGEGYVSSEFVTCENHFRVAETKEAEEERLRAEEEARQLEEAASQGNTSNGGGNNGGGNNGGGNNGGGGSPAPSGDTGVAYNPPSGGTGQAVADFAVQFVGCPYVYGGSSLTNGADCSGFVMAVYAQFGVSLPHQSGALRGVGYGVSVDEMQPGDIVCYNGHVGIYIGGGCIVHASTPETGIKISSAYYTNIVAVRRIF